MSRIGIKPIPIPTGVEIAIKAGNVVTVKGPKGQLTKEIPAALKISVDELSDKLRIVERTMELDSTKLF